MALTITQQPGNVSFAGNPILVKAKTSLSGKTFMRIVAEVNVTAEDFGSSHTYKESYTYSVAGAEEATLNVAETVNAAIQQFSEQRVDKNGPTLSLCRASYTVMLKEVYLDQMVVVTGDTVQIGPFTAVMGRLSDYELSLLPNQDIEAYLGTGMVLSRKPDNEVVYGGFSVIVPAVVTSETSGRLTVKQIERNGGTVVTEGMSAMHSYIPNTIKISTESIPDGVYDFSVTPVGHAYTTRKYIKSCPLDKCCSFLFLNGFGILESITALTGRNKGHSLKQDHYVEVGSVGQQFPDSVNMGGLSHGEIKVTSGYVTQDWADWWITEFLTSRKVWMWFGSRYLPVSVESEDHVVVHDPTHPELCEVKFTVHCAFSGSVVCKVR